MKTTIKKEMKFKVHDGILTVREKRGNQFRCSGFIAGHFFEDNFKKFEIEPHLV